MTDGSNGISAKKFPNMIVVKKMNEELTVRLSHESAKPEIPAIRWNKEECKKALDEMLQVYTNVVYTEEQVKTAKADRAAVNKIIKQLGDARKAVKAIYFEPVAEFEADVKELEAKAKRVSDAIDKQAKDFETAQKERKKEELRKWYADNIGDLEKVVSFEALLDDKWLLKSTAIKAAQMQLQIKIQTIREQMHTISEMCGSNVDACTAEFIRSGYNLGCSLALHKKIEDAKTARKAEEERRRLEEAAKLAAPAIVQPTEEQMYIDHVAKANCVAQYTVPKPTEEEPKKAYDFRVWCNREQIDALKNFLTTAGIKYGKAK